MSQQKFVKNTNAPPPESELWTIADGWKISAGGKTYTKLDQIYTVDANTEDAETINALYTALTEQLSGKVKEPIDYVGHYIVAGKSQDGTELVYAFYKNDLAGAEKQVKYSASSGPSVPRGPSQQQQQQQQQQPKPTLNVGNSKGPYNTPTLKSTPAPLTTVQRTIEVVDEPIPIAWDDAMEIAKAKERGLYVLPVDKVGAINFNFENKQGERCFLYGRIINVKVADN